MSTRIYNESINDDFVFFQRIKPDSKGRQETLPFKLVNHVDPSTVFDLVKRAADSHESASAGAVSALVDMIKGTAVLDNYRGKTKMEDKVSPDFNRALRNVETVFFTPILEKLAPAINKEGFPSTVADIAEFVNSELGRLNKGSYSQARTHVAKLFCKLGKIPEAPNGKIFTVAAITKMVENAEAEARGADVEKGLSVKLAKLARELASRNEGFDLGHNPTAIAALKEMLATYEGLEREHAERLTEQLHGATNSPDVMDTTAKAMLSVTDIPSVATLTAIWENNGMTDDEYKLKMLSLHNMDVNITLEEEASF